MKWIYQDIKIIEQTFKLCQARTDSATRIHWFECQIFCKYSRDLVEKLSETK